MAISAELGEKLEAVVEDLVKNGRYNSKSEVLREGVRLVQEREAALRRLDAALDEGLADIAAGRVHPAEDVFAELHAKYRSTAVDRRR
ncbi:MAG: type II toxin-antitoxin system ParD family antitoxin [Devosia sp.]|nr:type II toxin-antitoxin system ParD family antitoxin [Devosia sp.]